MRGLKTMEAETRFPPRYIIHQYWARKPWSVVRGLVEEFCPVGGTVLDPFMGSAVTCFESLSQNRNFIGIDINPVSVLMAKFYSNPPDLIKIKTTFDNIITSSHACATELYNTRCPDCNSDVKIINSIWKNGDPVSMYLNCNECDFRGNKKYSDEDLSLLESINSKLDEHWFPKDVKMPTQSDVDEYEDLFSLRNRVALSFLFSQIDNLDDGPEKDVLLLAFTSLLPRMSRMVFINEHRRSKGVNPAGVWGEKRYWVPNEHIENNVFHYFNERKTKFVDAIEDIGEFQQNTDYIKSIISLGSATNLSDIPNESVDFCFTDPPYGDAVKYLDLSTIWNAWISPEGVKSELEVLPRNNDLETYSRLLNASIKEIHRVLKENSFFAIAFQSTKPKIWKILLDSISSAGFQLVDLSSVRPSKKSHNQLDMSGSAKNDIILLLQKSHASKETELRSTDISFESSVISVAKEQCKLGQSSPYQIYENLVMKYSRAYLESNGESKFPLISIPKINKLLTESNLFDTLQIEEFDYKGELRSIILWCLSEYNVDNP
ncbi:DNA methyltransferase [Euryarchaeota archaeon]|nr:DNA methyltransferase [Euryarchaeota archaeon]